MTHSSTMISRPKSPNQLTRGSALRPMAMENRPFEKWLLEANQQGLVLASFRRTEESALLAEVILTGKRKQKKAEILRLNEQFRNAVETSVLEIEQLSANGVPNEKLPAVLKFEAWFADAVQHGTVPEHLTGPGEKGRIRGEIPLGLDTENSIELDLWTGTMVAFVEPGKTFGEVAEVSSDPFGKMIRCTNQSNGTTWEFFLPPRYKNAKDAILVLEHPNYELAMQGNRRIILPRDRNIAHISLVNGFLDSSGQSTDSINGLPIDLATGYSYMARGSNNKRVGPLRLKLEAGMTLAPRVVDASEAAGMLVETSGNPQGEHDQLVELGRYQQSLETTCKLGPGAQTHFDIDDVPNESGRQFSGPGINPER
ncbi:MAG: hypothetical protein ABII22_01670 [Candidatus Micrarchaeota archaeon]